MPDLTSTYTDEHLARITAAAATQTKDAKSFQRDAANLLAAWATPGWTYTPPPPPAPVPPAAAGSGWRLSFRDEFDGDLSKWNVQNNSTYGDGNGEVQTYMAANVAVIDGRLRMRTMIDPVTKKITSGFLTTRAMGGPAKFSVKAPCYFEFAMSSPVNLALWPSGWFIGDGTGPGWPGSGEADWELYSPPTNASRGWGPGGIAESNFHYTNAAGGHGQAGARNHIPVTGTIATMHAYGMHIRPTGIDWYLDGRSVRSWTAPSDAVYEVNAAHAVHLMTAVGGAGPISKGLPEGVKGSGGEVAARALLTTPQDTWVDYVRCWVPA